MTAPNRENVERFRAAIAQRLGFRVEENRMGELAEVLRRRMKESRAASIDKYLSEFHSSRDEVRAVAKDITVCETYFFRISEHFRAVAELVLPERIAAQSARRQLTLLSAGCSSGEEPYSLAITVRENVADLSSWRVTIEAVDINSVALAKARQARYSEWSLRETTAATRQRYFERDGQHYRLNEAVRRMVGFREANLVDPQSDCWARERYDIIFLRNVLMYFGPDAAQAVVSRLAESLAPGGYLFLGPAETLRGLSSEFHLCHSHNAFYYQRRQPGRRPVAVAARPQRTAMAESAIAPVVVRAAELLSQEPAPDSSWFADIQRASQRIQTLAHEPQSTGSRRHVSPIVKSSPLPTPAWDVKPALELLRNERFTEALGVLHDFPSESESDADVQLLKAVLLANAGRLAEAEKTCKLLLATNELNAGAHYVMALCREHAGDKPGAVEHDQVAIYLDPAFAMPHLHLGLMAKRQAQFDTACQELRQAAALLLREDSSRVLLFGGGFSREALVELCRRELRVCGGGM